MNDRPKCEICNEHDYVATCPSPEFSIKICLPCLKVYNEHGKVTTKTTDNLRFLCPKCNHLIEDI